MRWQPITDLPEETSRLELPELRALDSLWAEKRTELERLDGMKTFRERLIRAWSIETGVIERVYDLDRGTTELLVERGIDASLIQRSSTDKEPEVVARIIGDQREAIEAVFDFIRRERELSTSYIKELHATLTQSQHWVDAVDHLGQPVRTRLLHGDWKRLENNPKRPDGTVHEYCPPEQVASEMDRLVEMHLAQDTHEVVPEVAAGWLHHRFTQIHPFQDGNGRVARALASLIFVRAGWFPLTIDRDRKPEYIESLEAADFSELRYLTRMFGSLERDALVQALGIGDASVRELEGIQQVIKAAREDLVVGISAEESKELERVRATAVELQRVGLAELRAVKRLIDREISDYRPEFSARVEHAPPEDDRSRAYRAEVIDIAHEFHYFANHQTYRSWLRLRIADRDASTWDDFVISFHGIGREFRGLIAVAAFHAQYQIGAEGPARASQTKRENVTDELFQLNYLEATEAAAERFREWLRGVLAIGLGQWRASLPVARGAQ